MYISTIFLLSIFLIQGNSYASFVQEEGERSLVLGQKSVSKENHKRPRRQREAWCCKFCENNEKEEIKKRTRAKKRQKQRKREIGMPTLESHPNPDTLSVTLPLLLQDNPVEVKSSEEAAMTPHNPQPPLVAKHQRPKPVPQFFTFSDEHIALSKRGGLVL